MKNSSHVATWTQEEADKAAATLLVELNTEKFKTEASSKTKKTRRRQKKNK